MGLPIPISTPIPRFSPALLPYLKMNSVNCLEVELNLDAIAKLSDTWGSIRTLLQTVEMTRASGDYLSQGKQWWGEWSNAMREWRVQSNNSEEITLSCAGVQDAL